MFITVIVCESFGHLRLPRFNCYREINENGSSFDDSVNISTRTWPATQSVFSTTFYAHLSTSMDPANPIDWLIADDWYAVAETGKNQRAPRRRALPAATWRMTGTVSVRQSALRAAKIGSKESRCCTGRRLMLVITRRPTVGLRITNDIRGAARPFWRSVHVSKATGRRRRRRRMPTGRRRAMNRSADLDLASSTRPARELSPNAYCTRLVGESPTGRRPPTAQSVIRR